MATFRRSHIPDAEELNKDDSYQQILELDFDDMIPFVISNIRKPGIYSRLYMAINAIALAGIIFLMVWGLSQGWLTWTKLLKQSITGIFAGSIGIIPVHELFHGVAYRTLGARKIQFGANLQQLIFFVTADRFPVSRSELRFLALLPFVAINSLTLAITVLWMPGLTIFFGLLLLAHNMMCIGDFAIINYAENEAGEIFTYDEPEIKRSYFYKTVQNNLL